MADSTLVKDVPKEAQVKHEHEKPLINSVQDEMKTRSIGTRVEPVNEQSVAKAWDKAISGDTKGQSAAFGAIDQNIVDMVKKAVANTPDKEKAVIDLGQNINNNIAFEGGPAICLNEDKSKLTIAHMRSATELESDRLDRMSPQQRDMARAFRVGVGSNGANVEEKWVLPAIEPKTYEITDKADPATKGNDGGAATKEPYSKDVAGFAFNELRARTGLDFTKASKWDASTPEQQWFAKGLEEAQTLRGEIPPGVQIKAMAAVGVGGADKVNQVVGTKLEDSGDPMSMYLAASMASNVEWNGKAKVMDVKDADGNVVKNPNRPDGRVDSIYKQGTVYDVNGTKVVELYNDKDKGRMFAVADPGNLKNGVGYSEYAQTMVDRAIRTKGVEGPVEIPAYEKKIDQDLSGVIGMGVKGSRMYIAQAKMEAVWAGNKSGEFSIEKQSYEVATRGLSLRPEDPPATRIDSSGMILMKTTANGHVWSSASFNVADGDYKVPDIEKLKKEAGYTNN